MDRDFTVFDDLYVCMYVYILQAAGLEDVLGEGKVFCCCNLMDKSIYRSTILPVVEYSGEFSQITQTARNSSQRKVVDTLKKIVLKVLLLPSVQLTLYNKFPENILKQKLCKD